ncbi:hypothetical protein FHU38_003409 [Saccharomonospora amisosensis]|uniref:Uncharacterized protein n=1 Tax=Saccharomonospora amisosensis TaxID=1128677 RepID=A0A7X5US18_9PSEU|nr:hypothetical protein [Saccharomonospora amisosensis]NIJ13065.1 hypothetical protein [Saccharomonospora amisosensis]
MIGKDRELLARLAKTNRALAAATVELMQHQDGGELPAEGLRALADHLAPLVDELRQRADQLDAAVVEVES